MNIFILDESPYIAAQLQHDRHVVKMILESAQMLSAALHERTDWMAMLPSHYQERLYKSTHVNHPCTIWARESEANFVWLFAHLDGLISEYHRRFRKVHKTDTIRTMLYHVVTEMANTDRVWIRDGVRRLIVNPAIVTRYEQHTPFAVCMPDEFKADARLQASNPNHYAIDSYRNLYIGQKIFQDHVKWTRCDSLPEWLLIWAPDYGPRVEQRVDQLYAAHMQGIKLALAPRDPHPDSLKPVNPKALTRFGPRSN